jgi:hypothetical protein
MVRMRIVAVTLVLVAVTASLSVESAAAPTGVRLVRVTSPVANGDDATLVAWVFPRRVCSIAVYYTTRVSEAKGLGPKRPILGSVRWTWTVGTRTIPGRHRIVVTWLRSHAETSFVTTR